LIWDFLSVNILSREASGEEEVNEVGYEAQKRTGGMVVGDIPNRYTSDVVLNH
jgi:hypothetical protein